MKSAVIWAGVGLFVTILAVFPLTSKAADCPMGPWYNQSACQFSQRISQAPENEIFGERYTFAQVNWIINSIATIFTPSSMTPDEFINQLKSLLDSLVTSQAPDYATVAKIGGVPGILALSMGEIYANPPASGVSYINDSLAKLEIVPVAHAQTGEGFQSLNVIRDIWSASRNMAYFVVFILLIASGFLIMFRVKINPQTVVSLQTLIPRLVIALVLITFSYAIAGLIIDLMYVFIVFILGVFNATNVIHPSSFSFAVGWFTAPSFSAPVVYYITPWLLFMLVGFVLTALSSLTLLIPGVGAIVPGIFLVMTIIAIILTIWLVWLLFRIWWMLVKTYVTILLLIIAGPWQIMLDVIPGQSGFTSWIRNLIANAAVFVVVPIMLALNMMIWRPSRLLAGFPGLNPLGMADSGSDLFSGGNFPDFPLLGGHGTLFQIAVGYAILALIPKVADMIRDALKVPAFKYGSAFGEAVAPITNPAAAYLSGYSKRLSEAPDKGLQGLIIRAGGAVAGATGGALTDVGRGKI